MSSKTESDELTQRVRFFVYDKTQKFLFIDSASSKLNGNEIFVYITKSFWLDKNAKKLVKYYEWDDGNLEEIIRNSPNLLVVDLPEEKKLDKNRVKKILDIVQRNLVKKMILVSKKNDIFDDLLAYWCYKAGVVKYKKTEPYFPIHNIVLKDSLADIITDLVHKGADINQQNENKDTPLHLAVENGRIDLAHHLLSLGADVNLVNIQNQTVLHVALNKNFLDIANIILSKNIDGKSLNVRDDSGYTTLDLAAKLGNVDIMKKLVEKGADVNTKDNCGYTPLMYACKGGKDAVEYLLTKVKDVDIQKTFIYAAKTDNADVVRILIDSGADVNGKDHLGFNALIYAAFHGNLNTINTLLNHGADPNIVGYCNETPLYNAVIRGHKEVVKRLLKAGSRVNQMIHGSNILDWSVMHNHIDILLVLLEDNAAACSKYDEGSSALCYAILTGCTGVIDVVMSHGIDINVKNDQSHTILYSACEDDIPDVIRCLISQKADVNIKEDVFGWSPLHKACQAGHLNVVRALLDAGAYINDVTKYKETPLHLAVSRDHVEIVKELVNRGGDVTAMNTKCESALDIARKRQSNKIIALLSKKN